jgi:hypothetical protein
METFMRHASGFTGIVLAALAICDVSSAAGPVPDPKMEASFASCTTDASGYCTVSHALGLQPDAVLLTPRINAGASSFTLYAVATTLNATTFQLRAMSSATTSVNNTPITFFYKVIGPGT